MKAGAAHIAFTAQSRTAVRDFYAAALTAGGRSNGAPACRSDEDGHFNAAIIDLDGNSIEVVYKNGPDYMDDGTVVTHSRVITWRRTVTESWYDGRSVVSRGSNQSLSKQASAPPTPTVVSKAPSTAPKAPSVARSVSEPVAVPQVPAASESSNNGSRVAQHIVGTLLGAAAGAAVAYAFVASERDSAKKEAEFNAFKAAKAAVNSVAQFAQGSPQPKPPVQDPQPVYETQQPVHRNNDIDTASQYHASQPHTVRAIEAAPSWHGPLYTKAPSVISVSRQLEYAPAQSVAPSRSPQSEYVPAASVAPSRVSSRGSSPKAIEYLPAASVAPSKAPSRAAELRAIEYAPAASVAPSTRSMHRSNTSPELATSERARSMVSKGQSPAPSTFISTFVPDELARRNTDDGSVVSHRSSKSRKSHHSSKHHGSGRSRAHSRSPVRAPSEAPSKAPSKVGSVIGSLLGRNSDNRSVISNPFGDKYEVDDEEYSSAASEEDDSYTIAPSDSISQVSSSPSRRRHRRHHRSSSKDRTKDDDGKSTASRHSKHSSSSSKHTSKSHRSKSSSLHSSQYHTAEEDMSEASTVRPRAAHNSSSSSASSSHLKSSSGKSRSSRKDSATEYDEMFEKVQYGSGDVPIRGITKSMVDGGEEEGKEGRSKSLVGWRMAQRLRAFEK